MFDTNEFDKLLNHQPYTLNIKGFDLLVDDKVFAPDPTLTNSTPFLLNNLSDLKGKSILDVGTGTGILSLFAVKNGASKVLALDIDDAAINNAKKNLEKFPNVKVIKSNLFEKVEGKFDIIFGNLPILDEIWDIEESTVSTIEKFLSQAKNYLEPEGKVYFTWFSISDVEFIKDLLNKYNYNYKIITESKLDFDWYLFICSVI